MTGSSACEHIHKTGDGAVFLFSTWWGYVIRPSLSLTGVVSIMEAASQTHFFILDLHAFHLWNVSPAINIQSGIRFLP